MNEEGNILWGDELMILFSRDLLKRHPGAVIISEVKCSQRLFDQISLHGGVPIMWKAGHSLLKAKMKETHALLAGEMSGHMFFADRYFGYDDAIYASLRLLELLAQADQPLSTLLADLPESVSTPEIRVDCPDEEPGKALVKVLFCQAPNIILAKDSWVHCSLPLFFCRANLAAKRIASFMLESSALSLPAMSYAVP